MKQMNISPMMNTSEVQKEFSGMYPLLKIVFYKKAHDAFEGSKPAEEVVDDVELQQLSPSMNEAEVNMAESVTAKELEETFENKLGLHIQVFRRSGDTWLQTSKTDYWTLQKHQEHAV